MKDKHLCPRCKIKLLAYKGYCTPCMKAYRYTTKGKPYVAPNRQCLDCGSNNIADDIRSLTEKSKSALFDVEPRMLPEIDKTVQKKKTGRKPKVQKQELETVLEVPLDSDYDTLI